MKRKITSLLAAMLLVSTGCSPGESYSGDAKTERIIHPRNAAEREEAYKHPLGGKPLGRPLDAMEKRLLAIDDDAKRVSAAIDANKLIIAAQVTYFLSDKQQDDPKWIALQHRLALAQRAEEPPGRSLSLNAPQVSEESKPNVSQWNYSDQTDTMRGTTDHLASVTSINKLSFDFPYNGGSSGEITLRRSPRRGTDAWLEISKGQFICRRGYNDRISVKFDNGRVEKYTCSEPSDGSSNFLFISPTKRFIQKLKAAQKVTIEAGYYQAGNQQLTFVVFGLNWP